MTTQNPNQAEPEGEDLFEQIFEEAAPVPSDEEGKKPAPAESASPEGSEGDAEAGQGTKEEEGTAASTEEVIDWKVEAEKLKAEIEELKKAAPAKPVEEKPAAAAPAAEELPDDLKAFMEEYPEVGRLVEHQAKRLLKETLGSDFDPKQIPALAQQVQQAQAQNDFNTAVLGGFVDEDGAWVDGHSDALVIMRGKHRPAFEEWVKANSVDLAAIDHPKKAIETLTGFKKHLAAKAAAEKKAAAGQQAAELTQEASASIQGGTKGGGGAGGGGKPKADDFDSAFEEATTKKK